MEAQIAKGLSLLSVDVPIIGQQPSRYLSAKGNLQVIYNENAQKKFIEDFNRWNGFNVEIYKSSFSVVDNSYLRDYEENIWTKWGTNIVKEYKEDIERLINQMRGDIEKLPLIKCEMVTSEQTIPNSSTALNNKVFIVHGHDGELKEKVARTLISLGLIPVILHEQTDGGKTIIEKFEANAEDCNFAIILLTSDDLGQSEEENKRGELLKSRARQNVVFEMGYFMGRLTRSRVFILLDKGVDKLGDLEGLVYVTTDDEFGWKVRLVKELKNCGYDVDMNKI